MWLLYPSILGKVNSQGALAGIIALARLLTVRKALSNIPKRYMPIKKIDVPKVCSRLVIADRYSSQCINSFQLS